jgi:hypothetical protein
VDADRSSKSFFEAIQMVSESGLECRAGKRLERYFSTKRYVTLISLYHRLQQKPSNYLPLLFVGGLYICFGLTSEISM